MIKFSTANEFVQIKIERNKTIIALLESQNKLVKLQMILFYRIINSNIKKIETVKSVNEIEYKQLNDYNLEREYEIGYLTNIVNETSVDTETIIEEINILKDNITNILEKIHILDSKIPDNEFVTNLTIKKKIDNSIATNCRDL